MKRNKNPKWRIIQLEITKALEIYQIDYKLPKDIKTIKGIYFSIKDILSLNDVKKKQLGELSLLFNSKQEHPLHYTIDYTTELPCGYRTLLKYYRILYRYSFNSR